MAVTSRFEYVPFSSNLQLGDGSTEDHMEWSELITNMLASSEDRFLIRSWAEKRWGVSLLPIEEEEIIEVFVPNGVRFRDSEGNIFKKLIVHFHYLRGSKLATDIEVKGLN